ncbi:hypothetical protein Q5P01_008858 [Channa striata]|uniref:Uncharacterized protein n=1 Tax=Channa striata TaxID=64152 RepID=A0AA88N5T3_CHASR|nr:hypothetical protein Q5P01_008858 [Channa striata]
MEGGSERAQESRKQQQLSASLHQRDPEAQGRVAAESSSLKQPPAAAAPEQSSHNPSVLQRRLVGTNRLRLLNLSSLVP